MRVAVFSTVCASTSFFVPGADLRPAVQPAVVLQPAAPELVGSSAPQVVLIPSARSARNDASARWFAYGLFGTLFTMAVRSAASAAAPRQVTVPRPVARFQALRMSTAEVDQVKFTEAQIRSAMQ